LIFPPPPLLEAFPLLVAGPVPPPLLSSINFSIYFSQWKEYAFLFLFTSYFTTKFLTLLLKEFKSMSYALFLDILHEEGFLHAHSQLYCWIWKSCLSKKEI
jgi:hypothetical protein